MKTDFSPFVFYRRRVNAFASKGWKVDDGISHGSLAGVSLVSSLKVN